VLLRRVDVATAMRMAHDLQALVAARIAKLLGDEHVAPVTLSLGLAAVGGPEAARTVDDLLGRADRALYAAKRAGKDRVVATPAAAAAVEARGAPLAAERSDAAVG
jgi:two-component system, cell cycle response regulator